MLAAPVVPASRLIAPASIETPVATVWIVASGVRISSAPATRPMAPTALTAPSTDRVPAEVSCTASPELISATWKGLPAGL